MYHLNGWRLSGCPLLGLLSFSKIYCQKKIDMV